MTAMTDMCGRARLSTDFSEIKIVFNLPPDRPMPNFAPTWNLDGGALSCYEASGVTGNNASNRGGSVCFT